MRTIFSMDSLFFRTVGKFVDLVWLNILTLIFSIPIITVGASFTAMYAVTLRMARNEEGGITRGFINAFKDNFKNGTKVWVVELLIILFFAEDIYLIRQGILSGLGQYDIVIEVAIALLVLIISMLFNYIYPLLARYDADVKTTIQNAGKLVVAFLPRSVCMPIIFLFPVSLTLLSDYWIPLWIFYGLAVPCYFCSMLLVKIFEKVDPKVEEEYESGEV